MHPINKIHLNNSTKISLNDRFTILQKPIHGSSASGSGAMHSVRRSRSRSRSANRFIPAARNTTATVAKASIQSRRLLAQLDQNYTMRAALKIKRKSVRANIPARPRILNRNGNRVGLRRGQTALSVGQYGRLRRANSITNIRTMQADLVGHQTLSRSNSATNIVARLGFRGRATGGRGRNVGTASRQRLNRSNLGTLNRSNSRQNLSRSNSRPDLRRTNSQTNLRRTNSRQNLPLKRSNSRQRATSAQRPRNNSVQRPRLSHANSRTNLNAQQQLQARRLNNNRSNSRGRQPIRNRPASVNSRLGNRTNNLTVARQQQQQCNTGNNVIRGRVFKRRNSNAGIVNRTEVGARQRLGRSRTRLAQPNQQRTRSASRGRKNNTYRQGNNQHNRSRQPQPNKQNDNVRGRSRSRGRGGRPNSAKSTTTTTNVPKKSKEELDKELDQYMVNTKPNNDLDFLMG